MSMAEKKSLAWGARLMTLECGIRFLTDYLEGDHYFHIARPNHNLDRARTQFTLVRQMEDVFDQMLESFARKPTSDPNVISQNKAVQSIVLSD